MKRFIQFYLYSHYKEAIPLGDGDLIRGVHVFSTVEERSKGLYTREIEVEDFDEADVLTEVMQREVVQATDRMLKERSEDRSLVQRFRDAWKVFKGSHACACKPRTPGGVYAQKAEEPLGNGCPRGEPGEPGDPGAGQESSAP